MTFGLIFSLVCALVALGYGIVSVKWILDQPQGTDRMKEISAAVQEGATAYLNRQYITISGLVRPEDILTDNSKRDRGWDPTEFFNLGDGEITNVLDLIDSRHLPLARGRALDFGCGVGRLTQGLARFFDQADGVDISPSMIDAARQWNRYGAQRRFHTPAGVAAFGVA